MGSVPSINSLDFGVFSCTYMYCHLTFIFGTCRYLYIFHLERLSQIILISFREIISNNFETSFCSQTNL